MRYAREFKIFIGIAAVVTAILLLVGYLPSFWTSGDDRPLEQEVRGEQLPANVPEQ